MIRKTIILSTFLITTSIHAQGLPQPDFSTVQSCSQDLRADANIAKNNMQYSRYFLNVAVNNADGVYIERNGSQCTLIWDTVPLCRLMGPYENEPATDTSSVYLWMKPIITYRIKEQINRFNQGSTFNGATPLITVYCTYACNDSIMTNRNCWYELS